MKNLKPVALRICILLLLSINISMAFGGGAAFNDGKVDIIFECVTMSDSEVISVHLSGPIYGAYGNENVDSIDQFNKNYEQRRISIVAKRHLAKATLDINDRPYFIYLDYTTPTKVHLFHSVFLVSPGDVIFVKYYKNSLIFGGKDSCKFKCEYLLEEFGVNNPATVSGNNGSFNPDDILKCDTTLERCLDMIENYRANLRASDYLLLKSYAISKYRNLQFFQIRDAIDNNVNTNAIYHFLDQYKFGMTGDEKYFVPKSDRMVFHELFYLEYLSKKYYFDSCLCKHRNFNINYAFDYFVENFSGGTREWLIYQMVVENLQKSQDLSYCIDKALNADLVRNRSIRRYLSSVSEMLPGKPAFQFRLVDLDGCERSLKELAGKVVLMDFWFKGCSACSQIHPILDSIRGVFDSSKFKLVSVCIDYQGHGKDEWAKLVREDRYTSGQNLNLYLFADRRLINFSTIPLLKHYHISGCPTLILIDKGGKLLKQPDDPRMDHGRSLVTSVTENSL